MSDKVLVTYATKYGSTGEVAEIVAETLRAKGLAVDCQPVGKVRTLESYGAVVLGAPLYIGRLLGDAQRFLVHHQAALSQRAVAVFALGPTENRDEDWKDTRGQFDQELAKIAWLKPAATELFGGKLDPARLRFPDSLLTLLPASPLYHAQPSDARDWAAIRAWADGLPARFVERG